MSFSQQLNNFQFESLLRSFVNNLSEKFKDDVSYKNDLKSIINNKKLKNTNILPKPARSKINNVNLDSNTNNLSINTLTDNDNIGTNLSNNKNNINLSKPSKSSTSNPTNTNNKDNNKPKNNLEKRKKRKRNSKYKRPLSVYEDIGHSAQEITQDLLGGGMEGFDLNIAQSICDDGKPQVMQEAESYFIMRHNLSFPGGFTILSAGPLASESYGYRLSAEAVSKNNYSLVGTVGPNTVEGVWDQTWKKTSKYSIKSNCNFAAGFKSDLQKSLEQQFNQSTGPSFPSAVFYLDTCHQNWSTRIRGDMIHQELSLSFNRKFNENLMIGSKIVSSYEKRKSYVEFGTRYCWGNIPIISDNNNNNNNVDNNKNKNKNNNIIGNNAKHTIESMFNKDSKLFQLMYTHRLNKNAALTSRFLWRLDGLQRIMSGFGYRYQFGKHAGVAKCITGEISSDGCFRQTFTTPILTNMMLKAYFEMNHFAGPEAVRSGILPHKMGLSLHLHL